MQGANTIQTIHLSDYLKVLKKRKTLISVSFIIIVSMTVLFSFLAKPVYETSSVLVIDQEQTTSPISGDKIDFGSYQSQLLTFNTHFKLIKSKPVLIEMIRELKLDDQIENLETNPLKLLFKQLKSNIRLLLKTEVKTQTPDEKLDQLVTTIADSITIKTTRETRLLTISVKNTDPSLGQNIANSLARKYIEFDIGNRLDASKSNLTWMHNELYGLKKKLEDDEQEFLEYKKNQNVFSMEGKQKVIDQKITEFNNEYLVARNKRIEIDAKLEEIGKNFGASNDILNIRSIISNSSIDVLYATLTNLEVEASKLSKVFKAKHPKIMQIQGDVMKIKIKLQDELKRELESLKTERAVLFSREEQMTKNIGEFEKDALDAGSKELRYTILKRNVSTNQQLYDTLLAKVQESSMLTSGSTSNIRVVETASLPINPLTPNKKKNLLLSILLGFFAGIGLAFFTEYLDQSIKSENDVENYLGLSVLAVIPDAADSGTHGAY